MKKKKLKLMEAEVVFVNDPLPFIFSMFCPLAEVVTSLP